MKYAQVRGKDIRDAGQALPLLGPRRREWLRDAVSQVAPDHDWARSSSSRFCCAALTRYDVPDGHAVLA